MLFDLDPYFEHYVLSVDNDRNIKTCELSVTPTSLSFSGLAQTKTFYIESNSDWEITVPTNTWVTLSDRFGSNNKLISMHGIGRKGDGSLARLPTHDNGCKLLPA